MSITLNSKVYNFAGWNQNQQASYSETSGAVPSSFSFLTAKVNTGTGKSASFVKWNLSIPVVTTVDSECGCIGDLLRTYRVKVEVEIPAGSSASERTDVVARLTSLIGNAQFTASINSLTQPAS